MCRGKLGPSRFRALKLSTGVQAYSYWKERATIVLNTQEDVQEGREGYVST